AMRAAGVGAERGRDWSAICSMECLPMARGPTVERTITMMKRIVTSATLTIGAIAVATAVLAEPTHTAPAKGRYLPEYTKEGDLILPQNWRSWVFVGAPLTPDGLNDNKEGFPEYHSVYIEPGSYDIYKKTGQFPDGTIFFKELQRVLGPQQFPDESTQQPSGRGYFPGVMNGADVTVKDSKRYAETGGWGYYNFNHSEPKAPTAKVKAKSECAFCHIASAKKDEVWTQFYRELDN